MFLRIPKKRQFLFLKEFHLKPDFLQQCCNQITIEDSKEIVWENTESNHAQGVGRFLYVLKNVPKYHTFSYRLKANEKVRKSNSMEGYAIRLADFTSLDDYMKRQFSTNTRGNIRRSLGRLESSFEIKYIRYYGEITSEQYQFLMTCLKRMLIRRFQERNDKSDDLQDWGKLESSLFQLINNKQASLFVVSHKQNPLAISICYHYGKTLFYSSPSYDIHYSKFGLGNTMLYKQLEWAFSHGYRFFDMGWGKLDYKMRWCNHITMLQNHVLFPKKSIIAYILSFWEGHKTRLNFFLKKTKEFLNKRKKDTLKRSKGHSFENFERIDSDTQIYLSIDLEMESYSHLQHVLIDFIYRTKENFSDVVMYKKTSDPILFVIQGKRSTKKIVLPTATK